MDIDQMLVFESLRDGIGAVVSPPWPPKVLAFAMLDPKGLIGSDTTCWL